MSRKTTSVWMPLYIGDYLADTIHLRREEHGSYLLLIMAYWKNQGPLPDDDVFLSGCARVELAEWTQTVRKRIAPFFQTESGAWSHKRIDEEIAHAIGTQTARKLAAKAGNEAKARKRLANGTQTEPFANANGGSNGSQNPPPSPSQSHIKHERERGEAAPEKHFPEVELPDEAEVKVYAAMTGLAEWKALDWFNEMQGCGWKDFANRPIVNWKAVLTRVKTKWESDGRPMSPPKARGPLGSNTGTNPQQPATRTRWVIEKDIERVQARIEELKREFTWAAEAKKPEIQAKFDALKEEKRKLKDEFDNAKE